MTSRVMVTLFLLGKLHAANSFTSIAPARVARRLASSLAASEAGGSAESASVDATSVAGQHYRVTGVKLNRSGQNRYANLKVYLEPGDPYGKVVSYLRHGEVILSTDFVQYAGQSWVQHLVDESKQGLWVGEGPQEPFLGWSPCALQGFKWLWAEDEEQLAL